MTKAITVIKGETGYILTFCEFLMKWIDIL